MIAYIIFGAFVLLLIALILLKGVYDEHLKWKRFKTKLEKEYGDRTIEEYDVQRLSVIARYYEKHPKEHQIDDITWNDLSFDEIFMLINKTLSSVGEEYLYYKLRTPQAGTKDLQHFDEICEYFNQNKEQRINTQLVLARLGKTGKYSIYDYLDHLDILGTRKNTKHFLLNLLLFISACVMFVDVPIGLIAFCVVSVYNMTSYFKEKNETDMYISSFAYVMRLMDAADKLAAMNIKECETEIGILRKHKNGLRRFKRGSFWLMSSGRMSGSGNPLDILLDYLRMIFHLDLIQFNKMLHEVRKHLEDVEALITTLGFLESAIVVGEYRYFLGQEDKDWCKPKLHNKVSLSVKDAYHPLILEPVKNSIETEKGVLLTGSNASGKSTFLKMVAIEAILAQTIYTCLATEYTASSFAIVSSMSLRDNIEGGESYYIVEIKSIKRILEIIQKGDMPVLCFVDEVLRGTNTVERISASTEILKSMSGKEVICFAATHDIELTELLKNHYENYHFEEKIQDGDVLFNYELQKGKATSRNAIQLLKVMGYDAQIIEAASQRAAHFLETGVWMKGGA